MNKNDFMKAMSMIDDDLLHEADNAQNRGLLENETEVSGVEPYRRPVWQLVTTIAASLLLIVGVGAAGVSYMNHRGAPVPKNDNENIISASTEEASQAETATEADTLTDTEKKNTEMSTSEKKKIAETTAKEEKQTKGSSNTKAVTSAAKGKITTQVTTRSVASEAEIKAPVTTEPCRSSDSNVFTMLDKLEYHAISCDGLPDHKLTAPDGTVYCLNLGSGWVWRRPSLIAEADNEAPLPAEVISAIYADWEKLDIVEYKWIQDTEAATEPVAEQNYDFTDFDIFESLESLSYSPDTCDGIPEYVLLAPDGTWYSFNFSGTAWVWRKTSDMVWVAPHEALLTPKQVAYLKLYGEKIGMRPDIYD